MIAGIMFGVGLLLAPLAFAFLVWLITAIFYESKSQDKTDYSEYSDY
jgi:hypothetical protein